MQFFNAGLQMLSKLTLTKMQASKVAKLLRQEKRARNRQQWNSSGCGARECARRRQQVVYDAGRAARRSLPTNWT